MRRILTDLFLLLPLKVGDTVILHLRPPFDLRDQPIIRGSKVKKRTQQNIRKCSQALAAAVKTSSEQQAAGYQNDENLPSGKRHKLGSSTRACHAPCTVPGAILSAASVAAAVAAAVPARPPAAGLASSAAGVYPDLQAPCMDSSGLQWSGPVGITAGYPSGQMATRLPLQPLTSYPGINGNMPSGPGHGLKGAPTAAAAAYHALPAVAAAYPATGNMPSVADDVQVPTGWLVDGCQQGGAYNPHHLLGPQAIPGGLVTSASAAAAADVQSGIVHYGGFAGVSLQQQVSEMQSYIVAATAATGGEGGGGTTKSAQLLDNQVPCAIPYDLSNSLEAYYHSLQCDTITLQQ